MGFIKNHGYFDNNPTFRGMRQHLLNVFDRIFVLDLHGNANKREVTADGKPDKNVFDIKQGVAIIFAVNTSLDPQVRRGKARLPYGCESRATMNRLLLVCAQHCQQER